jgi:hypothetical protein
MNKLALSATALGIFTGLGGASHGPGEILQGNVAPETLVIEAWPTLTVLNGEPAMTIIPSYLLSGILTIAVGVLMAVWAGKFIEHKLSGMILILLTVVLLLVGGGLAPPIFGFTAGILAILNYRRLAKNGGES